MDPVIVTTASPKLLITAPYFKPRSGGLEEYSYQIAKGLQETHNWQVLVVASGDKDDPAIDAYRGLKVYRLPYWLRLSNTPFGFRWRRSLTRIIEAECPDIIVAHAPVPGMLEITASLAKKIPFVVTYHVGSMLKGRFWPDLLIRWYEAVVLPRVLRKASRIICCSAYVQRSPLISPYAEKSTVIHPGVETDIFAPDPNRVPGYRLVHVGGLKTGEEHKGVEISLRITAELKQRYPTVHLTVVGDGDKRSHYEALAEELDIAQQVEFCGRLAGQELVSAYQAADILIAPFHREAFGMVIAEAMACGVPPVASATGGIPDVVNDSEFGFLIEPNDIACFTKKISELFDDVVMRERFAQRARSVAVTSEYAWSCQVELTARLLESLI